MSKIYVTMTDSFMSGWGKADNKINKLVIECNNLEEAKTVEAYAQKRNEMKHISITHKKPYYNKERYYVSFKTKEDMPAWFK